MQLIKVETKVENVLKGRFDRNRLEFFYFEWADGGYSGPPLNMIRPGERGIYFLEKDGGVFRSINDVYLSNILLVSGQHEIPVPVPEDRIRNAIEEAILLPGQGVEFPGYLESLPIEAHIAVRWIGKDETVRILSTLLKNKDGRIRGRACIVLAEDPFGMRECLGALQNDAEALAEDRLQASRLIITRKQSTFENQRK